MAKEAQKARIPGTGNGHLPGTAESNGVENGMTDTDLFNNTPSVSGAEIEALRPKRNRWRIILPVLLALVAGAAAAWLLLPSARKLSTVSVERGSIISTVETTGKLEAETSAQLSFKLAGRVSRVLVKQGDTVKSGDVLAELEFTELERRVEESEIQLEISKLRLEQAKSGSREEDITAATADLEAATARLNNVRGGGRVEDIAAAQATLNQAQARLDAVKKGPATEDIASAEATLRQAQARLEQARQPATPAQISGAEAGLREAQAGLAQVQEAASAEQISGAEAALRGAQAQYDALVKGASEEDLAAAQAQLDQARANLSKLQAGATAEDVQAAQARLDQAVAARDEVRLSASNAKEQARLDVVQASNALQNAQDVYGNIKYENDNTKPQDLTDDDKNREAKALRDVENAQAKVDQASLNYETAKQTEISRIAGADASVQEAQAALDKVTAGPTAEDLSIAQADVTAAEANLAALQAGPKPEALAAAKADVDQAQANLDQLKNGGTEAEVAAAMAKVDQAQANLDQLLAGGTADEIAIAQADVDKAQAALDKVRAGATPEDITIAEQEVAQARSALDKVRNGATEAEIAEAQARVDAAQAGLDRTIAGPTRNDLALLEKEIVLSEISVEAARDDLGDARLTTPIAGTVLAINLEVGETVGGFQQVASVADINSLRVKADIDELDIGRVNAGQAVTVTLDAYPGVRLSGTIEKLAPGATQRQGSTVYQATVNFTKVDGVVPREGMAASVDVTAQRKDDVLLIPNRAIETVGDREYVTIQDGSATRKVEIETGLSNNTSTEVISGLEEGQSIVVK